MAVRQCVVVPKRLRYFLDRDADCLNWVAGIAMSEVQRATAEASTSTAAAAPTGGWNACSTLHTGSTAT